jgi:UDP-N-acetyl-D-mannosaminuronic acid dehydrogenase
MSLQDLNQKIIATEARLAVIGLGYVGLPVACAFAEAGFDVLGVDVKAERIVKINAGLSPIEGEEPGLAELLAKVVGSKKLRATCDYPDLADRDIIFIDVETPVNDAHKPEYQALRSVLRSLGQVLQPGMLVIVESTIAPGTMSGLVRPGLEEASHLKANLDFYLGNCPERVMPGKLLSNLHSLSRVCGGGTPETAESMVRFYRRVIQADLDPVDWITAELVKTVENAYRDVQIAFANEVALICEALGGDVWKVRELVNKSPYRQMHLPGAGVGGHCIPKDPWLLVYGVEGKDVPVRLIPTARAVNDGMPAHVADLLEGALAQAGRGLEGARILVLGYAYLEDSDDTRNSPSEALVKILSERGAGVVIHDPYVPGYQGDVYEMARGCDGVVVMVRHKEYFKIDFSKLLMALHEPVLIDGRHLLDDSNGDFSGWQIYGIGKER